MSERYSPKIGQSNTELQHLIVSLPVVPDLPKGTVITSFDACLRKHFTQSVDNSHIKINLSFNGKLVFKDMQLNLPFERFNNKPWTNKN